jgi:hypothetical protein
VQQEDNRPVFRAGFTIEHIDAVREDTPIVNRWDVMTMI